MNYEKLSKKAIFCMLINELIAAIIILAIGVTILLLADDMPGIARLGIVLFLIVSVLLCVISPFIRYERYRYRITDEELDVKEGFLWVSRTIVPIERLHKIEVNKGPVDSMFGLAKVHVTTAGGDVVVRFLDDAKANLIAEALKKKINEEAKEGKEFKEEN